MTSTWSVSSIVIEVRKGKCSPPAPYRLFSQAIPTFAAELRPGWKPQWKHVTTTCWIMFVDLLMCDKREKLTNRKDISKYTIHVYNWWSVYIYIYGLFTRHCAPTRTARVSIWSTICSVPACAWQRKALNSSDR